jgi:peptide/nickel transport system permease protein
MILGVRVSLSVGIVSVFISLIIGLFLGACAGYFGGWVDSLIMWFITVFWSIPTFLLAMGLSLSLTSEFVTKLTGIDFGDSFKFILIFIAVGLTMWVDMARMVRGQFISIKEKEYVEAAQSLGYSSFRTMLKHILPNIMGPVIVILAADFASAILIESALSYLGLGIQAPKPSWGQMLSEYRDFLNTNKAYLTLIPGFAIMCMVLAFNLIGNGLRDALDVRDN